MKNGFEKLRIVIILAAFALFFVSAQAEDVAAACTNGNDPPANGDWIINNTTVCTDGGATINGSLIITPTGNATFINHTLRFDSPSNGSRTLEVQSSGAFYYYGNDSCGYCSLIESTNPYYHYFFKVRSGATFFVNQTEIKDVGINSSEAEENGIYIATNNAVIINSNISRNVCGINLDNSNFSTITNNKFQSLQECALAVINFSSYNTIENNIFLGQQTGIDLAISTGYNSVRYNNITSSGIYGIIITGSIYNNITFNNIYLNPGDGIFFNPSGADPSSNNISYNNIYSNTNYDINNQQTSNITAEFNWWGTTDCSAINASIFDYYDNSSFGIVDWEPFLNASYPNGSPMNCPPPQGGGGGGPLGPTIYIVTANNTKTNDNTPLITFYFTDPDNTTAESRLYNSYCQFSTNNTTTQNNTLTDLESNIDPNCGGGIPDGNWSFWVNVTDYQSENKSLVYDILIDTTPPSDIPWINDTSNGTDWIFWEWPQDVTLGFSHYEIWLNNTFKENKSTSNYNATGLSSNTGYEIQVRPVDDVGNIGNWTNDTAFTQASSGGGDGNNDGGGDGGGGANIGTGTNISGKINPQARVPGVSQQINRTVQTPSGLVINLSKEFSARGLIKLELKVGDVIEVYIAKEPHTITVEKINAKNKSVTLIIRSTPTEVNLKESGSVLVDVDGDGKYDIKIIIDRVDGEKTTVILQDLKAEREQTPSAFLVFTEGQTGILGAVVGAAIMGTIAFVYIRRKRANEIKTKA